MREHKYKGVAMAVILLFIVATQTAGATIQSVNVWSAPPNITSFAPPSPVYNSEGETRTFNILINQIVNVSWLINGNEVFTEYSVNESVYTSTNAVTGTSNVSAIASNSEGTTMHRWTWIVTHAPSRHGATPTPITPTMTPDTPPEAVVPTPTEAVVPTPTKPVVAEETPTKKNWFVWFTVVFAIAGLPAIAYAIMRAKSRE